MPKVRGNTVGTYTYSLKYLDKKWPTFLRCQWLDLACSQAVATPLPGCGGDPYRIDHAPARPDNDPARPPGSGPARPPGSGPARPPDADPSCRPGSYSPRRSGPVRRGGGPNLPSAPEQPIAMGGSSSPLLTALPIGCCCCLCCCHWSAQSGPRRRR